MPVRIKVVSVVGDVASLAIVLDEHEERMVAVSTGDEINIDLMDEDKMRIIDGTFTEKEIKKDLKKKEIRVQCQCNRWWNQNIALGSMNKIICPECGLSVWKYISKKGEIKNEHNK